MSRAPKICSQHGCPNFTPCPQHTPPAWAGSTRRQRLPPGWERTRRTILFRQPLCQVCQDAPSVEVDHIDPGDDHRTQNLQGICRACHRDKTQREAAAARQGRSNA